MKRIKKLQNKFKENNIDCFLVTSMKNIYYLTDFSGDAGILLITPRKAKLITDYRFTGDVTERIKDAEVCFTKKNYFTELSKHRLIKRKDRIGFEAKNISYSLYWQLRKKMDWLKFKSFDSFVEQFRIKKTEKEVKYINEACKIADNAFKEVLQFIKPGVKEIEIAAELEYRMKKHGGEKPAFDTIVASGPRSSTPHGTASEKKLKKGEFITMDFGTYYRGYASDMTRTVFLGSPSKKDRNIYETVYESQKKAREAVKEGVKLKDLDKIARDHISEKGFGDYFTHSLGHGVGLEVHEKPSLSYKNEKEIAQKGMVITIEPGIYIPDYQGVRIEDTVLVDGDKPKILTNASRELMTL